MESTSGSTAWIEWSGFQPCLFQRCPENSHYPMLDPGFEIDRIDRFRALIDRFISIVTLNRSISIDQIDQTEPHVTRQRSCRILKRRVVGHLPPQKALNSSVSSPIAPARGALRDMRCVAIHRGRIQGSLPCTSPIYIWSTRSTIKSIDQDL